MGKELSVPERPLLKLPDPELSSPPSRGRGGSNVKHPSREDQQKRLERRFSQLERLVANSDQVMQFTSDPESIAPERAIVFEVAGSITEFHKQASKIGFEFLADDEMDFDPDEHFYFEDKEGKLINGCIYLAMPSFEALEKMLTFWKLYCDGKKMPHGFATWRKLFELLKDVRPWGPKDRLPQGTLDSWESSLEIHPDEAISFEVELWFRNSSELRKLSYESFAKKVAELDGKIIHQAVIEKIRYSAALVELPASRIHQLLSDPLVTIAKADEIMFIRPQTMAQFHFDNENDVDPTKYTIAEKSDLPPIAALFDGFPIQRHQRLVNRLEIDDPDNFEKGYHFRARTHGTAMASLIVHGDINKSGTILNRPIYVRPVMKAFFFNGRWFEQTPDDELLLALIERSIHRMFDGGGVENEAASNVLMINLSLGDKHRPFAGPMSPWGRLLDYLAYKYRILFLVSAGNVDTPLGLPGFASFNLFATASIDDRERAVFKAIDSAKSGRTLLSPAEAMNIITVGAAHGDAKSTHTHSRVVDPIGGDDLPNMSSAVGLGFRRIIKPDILLDGGREYVTNLTTSSGWSITPAMPSPKTFGLLVATPGVSTADLANTTYMSGTSVATALATRAGHKIYDSIMDKKGGSRHADAPQEYHSLIIKALLIHGASWKEGAAMLHSVVDGKSYALKDNVTRLLGHGVLDVDRVVECTTGRVTLIGYGEVNPGQALLYRMPLPPGLNGKREYRAITITLAWFSPINPWHQGYRVVALEAGPGGDKHYSLGVKRSSDQPSHHLIRKGTVFHDRQEGKKAAAYVDGGDLLVLISARTPAGEFDEKIPYAIAVSLEVGIGSSIQVYDEVRNAIEIHVSPSVAS